MSKHFGICVSCWFGLVLHIFASNVPLGPQMAYSPLAVAQQKMGESRTRLPIDTVEKGHRSGVRESLQVVIRSQDEWNAFWKRPSAIETNPSPASSIDFNREMVVGIFLDEKSTGGYEVEIVRAERSDSLLYFSYREEGPPPGAMLTQALTQPFHLIRVAKHDNVQVIFRRDS
jgi:PrcB C-terminal